ncbi:MAG: alpha/beta hydrolase [Proteobacteria bacterium]|nr:alpha/beta hydrolase [Pseudomonadota bacterium]
MQNVLATGIKIEYDTFGDRSSPALLLIMGVGAQMIVWDERFCRQLAEQGFFVIRFDNRDVGLSQKFDDSGIPDVNQAVDDYFAGKKIESPYSLEDMADDAVGLLDVLDVAKAHICGASMGGGIAQIVAYRHPSHVSSLVSIMSATSPSVFALAKPEALEALFAPSPEERSAYIEEGVKLSRTIGSPGFPFDEKRVRELSAQGYDRCYYPQGMARQLAAILAYGEPKPELASIKAPSLVIHGSDDPLVSIEGGKNTAEAIPGSELLIIDGMGHNLPEGAWPQIIEAISNHTRKAEN